MYNKKFISKFLKIVILHYNTVVKPLLLNVVCCINKSLIQKLGTTKTSVIHYSEISRTKQKIHLKI